MKIGSSNKLHRTIMLGMSLVWLFLFPHFTEAMNIKVMMAMPPRIGKGT
jgi:hypothetical protein